MQFDEPKVIDAVCWLSDSSGPRREYSASNIRRRDLYEYLRFTGDLANRTKDLKDGETLQFEII